MSRRELDALNKIGQQERRNDAKRSMRLSHCYSRPHSLDTRVRPCAHVSGKYSAVLTHEKGMKVVVVGEDDVVVLDLVVAHSIAESHTVCTTRVLITRRSTTGERTL